MGHQPTPSADRPLLSPREVATIAGVSLKTVYREIDRGGAAHAPGWPPALPVPLPTPEERAEQERATSEHRRSEVAMSSGGVFVPGGYGG